MASVPHDTSAPLDGLRPEIIRFLEQMSAASAPFPNLMNIPVPEARDIAEVVRQPFTAGGPEMAETREMNAALPSGPVKIRVHYPVTDKPLPCLFYIHGGGWVLFSLDTHDRLMREYAAGANVAVIGIDYSLAPESKFPSQIHEITDTVRWCLEHADALGIDPEKVAIGGDSAGANLSVATCLNLKKQGHEDSIKAMVLNYGVFDARRDTASYETFGGGEYLLSAEEMHWFWQNYLNTPAEAHQPLASPVLADVRGLPPTFMVITDHDVLYDENIRMRDRLSAAGVNVRANIYAGTTHSFLEATSLGGVAAEAIGDTSEWLTGLWQKQ
jgi:acetyl esterase